MRRYILAVLFLAAFASLASIARGQSPLYCYTDPFTRQVSCFTTYQACSQAAVNVPGARCEAR